MSSPYHAMQAALAAGDVAQARYLFNEARRTATADADVYFLASQLALDEAQRRAFLQQALDLNPFHEGAYAAMQSATRPVASTQMTEVALSQPTVSAAYRPASQVVYSPPTPPAVPSIAGRETAVPAAAIPFDWFKALLPALLGWGLTGFVWMCSDIVTPFPDYLTYSSLLGYTIGKTFFSAINGFIAGIGTGLSLRYALPKISSGHILGIGAAWSVGWALPNIFRFLMLYASPSYELSFILEWFVGSILMILILATVSGWKTRHGGPFLGIWGLAYFVCFCIFWIVPDDNSSFTSGMVSMVGNTVLAFIGASLSLRQLQTLP